MADKKRINEGQIVGTFKEMNLKCTTETVTLKSGDFSKTVECKVITKNTFKNPMFTVEVDGRDVGVDMFKANEKKLDENGNIVDNPTFKAMQTMIDNWTPKSADSDNATRVKFIGKLTPTEYPKDGDWKVGTPTFSAFEGSSSKVSPDDSDVANGQIDVKFKSIVKEVVNEDETGRLIVTAYFVDRGLVYEFKFFVNSDLASSFEDFYNVGDTACVSYDIVNRHVGKVVESEVGWGKSAKVDKGWDVSELILKGGSYPYDKDENESYITDEELKTAKEAKEVYMTNRLAEAENKTSTSSSSSKIKGYSNNNVEDLPFANTNANPFAQN